MAVDVEITGNGTFAGAKSNIGTYSVQEDSTPVIASDSSGGVGQITFNAIDDPNRFGSMFLMNNEVTLADGDRGTVAGRINAITSNDRVLSVTADSRLGELVGERRAESVDGTLEQVIVYYLELCGVTTDIAIDDSLRDRPVVAPGFIGDVWVKLKELLVLHRAEITMIRGNVTVRPVRGRKALEINNISESWSVGNGDLAEFVEVAYYGTEVRDIQLIYPPFGWNEDVQIYSVDADETQTINIPVDGWIQSLVQPAARDYVSQVETDSVYSVIGNDGRPITAAQWLATGGRLTVAPGEDGTSIDVTLVGAGGASAKYAPYRIAMSAGTGNAYSSLRIRGSGVVYDRQTITVPTSAGGSARSDAGATVDSIYVRTKAEAYDLAAEVAGHYSSPSRTLNITKADINKPGSSENSYNYVTFGEFDEYLDDNNVETFAQFDAFYAGQTFADLDQYWYEQVEDDFDFQMFGNASGARMQYRRNMYRIRSVTTTESNVSYTAEADTTFGDFDSFTSDGQVELVKNLIVNPSMSAASGTVEVYRNLSTNPSFELPGASIELRRNLFNNPAATSLTNFYATAAQAILTYTESAARFEIVGGLATNIGTTCTVTPGENYRIMLRARANRAIPARMRLRASSSGGSITLSEDWEWYEFTGTSGSGNANQCGLVLTQNNAVAGDWIEIDRVLIAEDGDEGPWFSGSESPDPELTPEWTSTPNSSPSILTRTMTVNSEGFRSSTWAASGDYSLHVPALEDIAGEPAGFQVGEGQQTVDMGGTHTDRTLYGVAGVIDDTSAYNSLARIGHSATVGSMQLRTNNTGVGLGVRIDTVNGASNSTRTFTPFRPPGIHTLWAQVSEGMTRSTGNADTPEGLTPGGLVPGDGMQEEPFLIVPGPAASQVAIAAVAYADAHDEATRARVLGWLKTRYSFATLDNQTFMITPRNSGQIVYFNGVEHVTTAGVPVRLIGTGNIGLSEGWWDEVVIVDGNYAGPYFDGYTAPDNDFTPSWVSTPHASHSILSGIPVTGLNVTGCVAIRSTQWSKSGPYSARLIRKGDLGGAITYNIPVGDVREDGTFMATVRFAPGDTGIGESSGAVVVNSPTTVSLVPAGVNEYEHWIHWTDLEEDYYVAIYQGNGGDIGDVWVDSVGLFAGEYLAAWFDGNTTDYADISYRWDGSVNMSTSTKYEGYPTLTFEEFDRLFDGKTFSDFALAPLVNVDPNYDK